MNKKEFLINNFSNLKTINTHSSHTTNSMYILLKDDVENKIYSLALSDHEAYNHDEEVWDIEDDDEELANELANLYSNDFDEELEYYGIQEANKNEYLKLPELKNMISYDRLRANQTPFIKSAKLIEENRILVVEYTYDTEYYINYTPEIITSDEAIQFINNRIQEIKKSEYADIYSGKELKESIKMVQEDYAQNADEDDDERELFEDFDENEIQDDNYYLLIVESFNRSFLGDIVEVFTSVENLLDSYGKIIRTVKEN